MTGVQTCALPISHVFVVLGYAVYVGVIQDEWGPAIAWGISGVIILVLFMMLIVREYEILR